MVRGIVVVLAFVFALPAAAYAADLSVDASGVLRYTGSPGKTSNVRFSETGTDTASVQRFPGTGRDDDEITLGAGCTGANPYVCGGVKSAVLDAGDMSDRLEAGWLLDDDVTFVGLTNIPVVITGDEGNDVLSGGARDDRIDGGAGNDDLDGFTGNDTLVGGDGNDDLKPNTGTDTLVGGDGIDTATFWRRLTPSYSLDGLRNDGAAGENDLIGTDVENVEAAADTDAQTVTITGDGRANRLTVQAGKANITGGDGADVLEGASQDDTINARDGSPDVVICNGGTDTVLADTLDTISPSCENVQVHATPGGAFDDRAPSLQWTAPTSASLSANAATTLSVNAADDRGVTKVQFFDDDRLVCEVAAAPSNCAYQPRGGDVGRNTLIAVAVDGAGQTATSVRAVEVRRFSPKRVTLTRTCEYTVTFSFRTRAASRMRFQAKFGGNEVLSGASSKVRTARLG
jgi:hypothetical protein